MTTFYFIRNAETEMEAELNGGVGVSNNLMPAVLLGRSDQSGLSERGKREAQNLGRWMQARMVGNVALIASSPAPGALETAEIALERTRFAEYPLVTSDELEAMNYGVHEGRRWRDLRNDPEIKDKRSRMGKNYAPEGGESTNQVGARILAWAENQRHHIERLQLDEQDGCTVVVFAALTSIRALAGYIRPHYTQFDVDHMQLNSASVSKLSYKGLTPVIQLNASTQIQRPKTLFRGVY
jgi:broad specificity phosphatase PhoE